MIRTVTHLTIVLSAIATAILMSARDRTEAAIERSKDETGAISIETILVAIGLSAAAVAVGGLIIAAVRSKGAGL